MKFSKVLAAGLFALSVGAISAPAQADIITFNFSGQCYDCGTYDEQEQFHPEAVSGSLTLQDYTPGEFLDAANIVSFHYNGSRLLAPFTVDGANVYDAFGIINADGSIPNFPEDSTGYFAMNFYPLHVGSNYYEGGRYLTYFTLYGLDSQDENSGYWEIGDCGGECTAADYGNQGTFSTVPAPGALALLGLGLLGLGAFRRKLTAA